jgi:hypothetical protein
MNPSKERAGAEQGLTIETGSIFLFDAFLVPGILAEFPGPSIGTAGEMDSRGLTLERHLELDALIQQARSSKIFGDLDGTSCFTARPQRGGVRAWLEEEPEALTCTDALVLTSQDQQLSRTLLLVGLNFELRRVSVDEVIGLIQSAEAGASRADLEAGPKLRVSLGHDEHRTVGEALEVLVTGVLEWVPKPLTQTPGKLWCTEIRRAGAVRTAAELLEDAARPLYGLLHADEGWQYVPKQHATAATARHWGARDYLAVLAQPSGVLVLNLEPRRSEDRRDAIAWGKEFPGLAMPHMQLGTTAIAAFEHGALFALQRSLMRRLAARELEHKLFELSRSVTHPQRNRFLGRFRRLPALFRVLYRGAPSRLYKDLLRVSSGGVSELAELQLFIDRQVGATALLERLHRAAELVDIEVRDHRLTALNLLVVVLTVLTIAIGVLQLVFG